MRTKMMDGTCYGRMLLGGAAMLAVHIDELNALNVFPVADGDTGTNMLKTIEGGLAQITESTSIGDFSKAFSRGILLSARGNSGVILSQIFAGINDVLQQYETVDAVTLADAYRQGIEKSYAAVQNPTEGTILTVFRESTEYAAARMDEESTLEDFYRFHLEEARRALAATKELLPVLAEADVVDSGAAGYLYIAEGMCRALSGEEIRYAPDVPKAEQTLNLDSFTRDSVLEYGYCTECLLRLTTAKTDPDEFQVATVVSLLQELGGESIVAYKQDDIIKVHVHTFTPGQVLAALQTYGEFLTLKIENMNVGHTEKTPKKPKKDFAVVTVSQGAGMAAMFEDMGADVIVEGGQTANPSIEDFINAFKQCDADDILVLPNNKNVILAANQASQLYTDAKVHVIATKNIAQGYSALSVISPVIKDIQKLIESAQRAAEAVIDGEITCAVRDAVIEGTSVAAGQYMAISGGSVVAVEADPEQAVLSLLEQVDMDLCEMITLFVGEGVSDARRVALTEHLKARYDEYEITVHLGGQQVYDYLIAVE